MHRQMLLLFSLVVASSLALSADLSPLEQTVTAVESCRKDVPSFEQTNRFAIDSWRHAKAAEISAVERDPVSKQKIDDMVNRESDRLRAADAHAKNMYSRICNFLVVQMIGGEPKLGGPTPVATWNQFLGALKKGDGESVLSVMSDSNQPYWERATLQMKTEGMQKFASLIIGELVILDEGPDSARATVRLKSGIDAPVEFTRYGSRWFISKM